MTQVNLHWGLWLPLWLIGLGILCVSWRVGQLGERGEFLPPPADDAHRIVQETCIRCHIENEVIR